MGAQEPPRGLQRSHWKRYVFGGPLHEPRAAISCRPIRARPVMCGAFRLAGTPSAVLVGLETAEAVPLEFMAETRTSSLCPESAPATTYVAEAAPLMALQLPPLAPQRSHRYAYLVGSCVHEPRLAESRCF